MIDRQALLSDLQAVLKRLEADLLERSESAEVPEVGRTLRAEYERARQAERTAANYEDWRSDAITQAAAAWVLSCVFVRFLEDNRLIDPPKLSGQASVVSGQQNRLQRARDEHELYFRAHPRLTDRDYLLAVFDELAALPGTHEVFGEHNPIRELPNWLSGDAGGELLRFFQKIDANSGVLVHDFTDPQWDTRFLGDLYQDLSEAARKKYALLQTPEFVEEFILDRTLEPAVREFELDAPAIEQHYQQPATPAGFRMIDPACGSGHFLLGSFWRLFEDWRRREPGAMTRVSAQRALDSIHGVDLNPYAVAISRFRLLLAALKASGIGRLADAPPFEINVACGDSLLHGPDTAIQTTLGDIREEQHTYWHEDLALLRRILRNGHYHAVVANPPYITPKDRGLNQRYRNKYDACHMKYSLSVPFMARIFRLAISGTDKNTAGFTGQITANSFMKREFGKKLIEVFLPQVDLTHVIDTSGAYIPGHGTPTVILFGRNRKPVGDTIRTVMGIRGEPSTPSDPSRGRVWSAIVDQIDQPGSQSAFVSVGDSPREAFHKHPWSIGGGGAAELKQQLEESSSRQLAIFAQSIGFMSITGEDDVFVGPPWFWKRRQVPHRAFGVGDCVRDWQTHTANAVAFMYRVGPSELVLASIETCGQLGAAFWPYRTSLRNRLMFGKLPEESGLTWYEYRFKSNERLLAPLSIVYGEVATHNHFVLDRGGKVFKQTAPVIKLPPEATEDDHLALLGLLNSSTACFWLKQVCHNKGSTVDQHGARQRTDPFEDFFAFNSTKLQQFPMPAERPLELASCLDRLAQELRSLAPDAILTERRKDAKEGTDQETLGAFAPLREALSAGRDRYEQCLRQMIALQEELDWECYRLYGLTEEDLTQRRKGAKKDEEQETLGAFAPLHEPPSRFSSLSHSLPLSAFAPLREVPPLQLGQRAFEIVMARKMAAGELQTTWFERHGSTPITEIPADWPEDYKRLVERRVELIETDRNIGLIEQPEHKRRWNTEPWDSQLDRALRTWLLDRLETYFDFDGRMSLVTGHSSLVTGPETNDKKQMTNDPPPLADISLTTVSRLADVARQDADFMQVGEVYRDDRAFDVDRLVAELVETESVPLLPVLRYKPSGLRKRQEWEQTWELQREEDRRASLVTGSETNDKGQMTNDRLDIPVPPKYTSADFLKSDYWRLRGKLDVPKERWVSFPHCEGPDGTLVIAWAGYDHLQLARSISAYFVDIQERLGGRDDPRLVPLLACLLELLPWLKQWHNDVDPEFGERMGDFFQSFVNEEARQLGKTIPEIKAWQPPSRAGGRRKRS